MSLISLIEIPVWPKVYGGTSGTGKIKSIPEDFIVEEMLAFEPEGEGEHAFLQIQKTAENTEYIARLIARFAGVRQRDIGYAGLKDRHGKTTQWFSVWLPGKQDPDWKQLETENIKVIFSKRHLRKLKRGVLSGNQFQILIRDWVGEQSTTERQLQHIKQQGFPNYFGTQRFGHQGQNINKALAMFQGSKTRREQRSLYLSAVRSYLFNLILAERIIQGNWNQAITGDVLVFDQSNSYFKTEHIERTVLQRINLGEIHPTGLMFGQGELETNSEALAIEKTIIGSYTDLTEGLIKFGLKMSRRTFRVIPEKLDWEFKENVGLYLKFSLPAGCYATSLLSEIVKT